MKLKDLIKKAESELSLETALNLINSSRERCPDGNTLKFPISWAFRIEQHCDSIGIPCHHSGDGYCETAATYTQLTNYIYLKELDEF